MIELINGSGLMERGIADMRYLRPVLAANGDARVSNATLRKDEWETIDDRVNEVVRARLTVIDDLRGRGLVTPVSLGTILRVTERLTDMDPADLSFDGDVAPSRDRVTYEQDVRPIPILSKEFTLSWRQLAASRERGDALDTTSAEQSGRKVRDLLQDLVTNGWNPGGPQGNGIPGLTSAANRLTVALTYNWDTAEADIIGDVEKMLDTAYNSNLFGPFIMYVPKNYWATLQGDYSAVKGERTYMERIMAFSDVEAIRPNDALADDNVLLVDMTRETLDLSEAQMVTTVQWEKNPFVTNFRVLTVAGPQIKSRETDQGTTINGIVHLS